MMSIMGSNPGGFVTQVNNKTSHLYKVDYLYLSISLNYNNSYKFFFWLCEIGLFSMSFINDRLSVNVTGFILPL